MHTTRSKSKAPTPVTAAAAAATASSYNSTAPKRRAIEEKDHPIDDSHDVHVPPTKKSKSNALMEQQLLAQFESALEGEELSLNDIPTSYTDSDLIHIIKRLMPSHNALNRVILMNAIRDKLAASVNRPMQLVYFRQPVPPVVIQQHNTIYTSCITPSASYSQFRESVKLAFACRLSANVEFTLHYYTSHDNPLSKVNFDHVDESVQNQRWALYLRSFSHVRIALFLFKKAQKQCTPLSSRIPKQLHINIPIPTTVASTDSPTEAAKANKRDDATCVMCGDLSVPYVNRIIPDNEWWFKQVDVDLAVPHELVFFIDKNMNMVTMCDECQELFNMKAALWVEVDKKAKDPSQRLKLVLKDRIPEATDKLSVRWKNKFPAGEQHFVHVPIDPKEQTRFPCWRTYDALWQWRLEWSKQKYALLCEKEDTQQQQQQKDRPKRTEELSASIGKAFAPSGPSHRRKRKKETGI